MQRLKSLSDTKILNSRKNEYIAYSQSLKKIYQLQDIDLLLNQMLDNQLFPNTVIINQLIKKLSQVGFEYVDDLYRIAVNKGIADSITYSSTIDAIAKSKKPNAEAAIKLLEEAKKLRFADKYIYANTIDAIAKSELPNAYDAIRLLEEAKKLGFADVVTYNNTIDAIAKSANPNVDDAIRLLEEEKTLGIADAITYNSTIDTIAKSVNPNVDAAIRLIEEAKELGFANAITYNSTLDAIAKSANPNVQNAIRLLEEAKTNELLKLPTMTSGNIVDLHDLSFGSAYFWMKKEMDKLLLNSTDTVSITFIYGKGLNSKANGETHPIKQAVLKIVRDMQNDISDCNEIEGNIGRFHINFQRKKLNNELHKQADYHDITLKHRDKKSYHSQQLFAQYAAIGSSTLNPEAKPFTPQNRNY